MLLSCLASPRQLPVLSVIPSQPYRPLNSSQQWQQAGRAGRRSRESLVVFVADSFPVDQHYVENPEQLWEKPTDDLIVDLESKVILEG